MKEDELEPTRNQTEDQEFDDWLRKEGFKLKAISGAEAYFICFGFKSFDELPEAVRLAALGSNVTLVSFKENKPKFN